MATTRQATATWSGDLATGNGSVTAATTGIFRDQPTTWASRTGEPQGVTSPEELLAAAHASCFSMALSHALAQAGTPPEQLSTSASVTFVPGEGITTIALSVVARVPGLDAARFAEEAEGARTGCPVSQALAAVPEITLDARLES
jgi:lipoyl-dependent peroxiredoxin